MIYFVRHGESEANLKNLFAGQRDNSPLTEKGRLQAKESAAHIKSRGISIDAIISSPLDRALETAKIIAVDLGYDASRITVDKRIAEYDMGARSGTPHLKVSSKDLVSAEGAEDPTLFLERVLSCMNEVSGSSKNTLVVSHAGVGRMVESVKEHKKPDEFYDIPAYENGSVVIVDWI